MTSLFHESVEFFAAKTTMHGVKNFVDADNRFMRTLWALIVIVTFSLAIGNGKLN